MSFLFICLKIEVNVHQGSLLWPYVPYISQDTYLLADYIGQLVGRLLAEVKNEGSNEPVYRCSRIRTTAFIPIKSIEFLGKNSIDERASMYRCSASFTSTDTNFDWTPKFGTVGQFGT